MTPPDRCPIYIYLHAELWRVEHGAVCLMLIVKKCLTNGWRTKTSRIDLIVQYKEHRLKLLVLKYYRKVV